MLRTVQSLPPYRAFDTGLRPDPFPDRAASLLPGLLAATRTGLPPASDDELTTADQPLTRSTSCLLGARENLIEPSGVSAAPGRSAGSPAAHLLAARRPLSGLWPGRLPRSCDPGRLSTPIGRRACPSVGDSGRRSFSPT